MNKIIDNYPVIVIIIGIIFLAIGFSLICKTNNTEKIKQESYLKGYEDCQKGYLPEPYKKIIKRNPDIQIKKFKG